MGPISRYWINYFNPSHRSLLAKSSIILFFSQPMSKAYKQVKEAELQSGKFMDFTIRG